MVLIETEHALDSASRNVHILTTEVLLRAVVRNHSKSKNLHDWKALSTILLPPLLTAAVVIEGELAAAELLNKLISNIPERGLESTTYELDSESTSRSDKEKNTKDTKDKVTGKPATVRNTTDKIAANFDNILTFLQTVAVKGP